MSRKGVRTVVAYGAAVTLGLGVGLALDLVPFDVALGSSAHAPRKISAESHSESDRQEGERQGLPSEFSPVGPNRQPPPTWGTPPAADNPQVAAVRAAIEEDIDTHRSQPVDPNWGPASAEQVRDDLEASSIAALIDVVDVDCRSTTCLATVEWEDYGVAFRTYRRLLTHHYGVNCRRRMGVPPPADSDGPYRAHLFLDCSDRPETRGS